jgi:hypothetical protein
MYVITLPHAQVKTVVVDEIATLEPAHAAALAAQSALRVCTANSACVVLRVRGADVSLAHLPRAVWAQLLAAVPEGAAVAVRGGGAAKQVGLTIEEPVEACARFDRAALAALVEDGV